MYLKHKGLYNMIHILNNVIQPDIEFNLPKKCMTCMYCN